MDYPSTRAERDRWVVAQRGSREIHDPRRPGGWLWETEAGPGHAPFRSLTVFLTNRECPWRCVFCDLWKHALADPVHAGDIPHQLESAWSEAGGGADQVKLYNAGSYFDQGAIPSGDDPLVARRVGGTRRVVVESHPRLVGDRTWRFRDLLTAHGGAELEVAMGLETVDPAVLPRLNKGVGLEEFARVTRRLRREGIHVRAFLLVQPPFQAPSEAPDWVERSAAVAFELGIERVSLIPVRGGNGALERLQALGAWSPPTWSTVESAVERCLALGRGWVDVDSWDLDRLPSCEACDAARRDRLLGMVHHQQAAPRLECARCGSGARAQAAG